MPAPTLARDDAFCGAAPNSVRTADFSASAFDFMMVAATCICTLPACAASIPLTMLIISMRHTPSRARYPATVNVACPRRGAAPLQRCTAEPGPANREWYLQWTPDQH